jgi:hypothetical protein
LSTISQCSFSAFEHPKKHCTSKYPQKQEPSPALSALTLVLSATVLVCITSNASSSICPTIRRPILTKCTFTAPLQTLRRKPPTWALVIQKSFSKVLCLSKATGTCKSGHTIPLFFLRARAESGDIFTVEIETEPNNARLTGDASSTVGGSLCHFLQQTIHYSEDWSGCKRETSADATFRT